MLTAASELDWVPSSEVVLEFGISIAAAGCS